MRLDDPAVVATEYASEEGLRARVSIYAGAEGPDAREIAFEAVAEAAPSRVLEVGCGTGEFAERVACELRAELVALDTSARMVELARARGIDARVGDVQELPFGAGAFDCAAALWMLFHVPDLDRALSELARVLRPGGRLVAATNGRRHFAELSELLRVEAWTPGGFSSESGAEVLRRHFRRVERRDVEGALVFPDAASVRAYVASSIVYKHLTGRVPDFEGPFRATRRAAIFVART